MNSGILSTSEARTKLYTLVDQVGKCGRSFTLTKRGKPAAILLNPERLESLLETVAVLSDQGLMRQIKESAGNIKRGETHTLDELKKDFDLE